MRSECFQLKKMLDKRKHLCYHIPVMNNNETTKQMEETVSLALGYKNYIMESMDSFNAYLADHYDFPQGLKNMGLDCSNGIVKLALRQNLNGSAYLFMHIDSEGKVTLGRHTDHAEIYAEFNLNEKSSAKAAERIMAADGKKCAPYMKRWSGLLYNGLMTMGRIRSSIARRNRLNFF